MNFNHSVTLFEMDFGDVGGLIVAVLMFSFGFEAVSVSGGDVIE